MITQDDRERQIINLTSKLPRKKLIVTLCIYSLVGLVVYFNYRVFTADVFKTVSFLEFMGMNRREADAANIPNYFVAITALLFLLDIISLFILFMKIGPTIGRTIKNIWNKFPD